MLSQLTIRNFALIESAEINFPEGFIAITGETGSGKSILLGALNLILGERADYAVIRDTEKKTIVEGTFLLNDSFREWFDTCDIDWSPETVIRREITAQGKSRTFINDTPVQLAELKELTSQLIYIHSQHQTLEIRNAQFQLNLIDAFSGLLPLADDYRSSYNSWKKNNEKLKELREQFAALNKELDFLNFQTEELAQLELHRNDYHAFEAELKRVDQLDDLKAAFNALSGGITAEEGPLTQLRSIHNAASKWKTADAVLASLSDRLGSVVIELDDLADEAASELEKVELNPERKQFLTEAVDRFNTLLRKHQVTGQEELMQLFSEMESKVGGTNTLNETIAELEKVVVKELETVKQKAEVIHDKRLKGAVALKNYLTDLLSELKMPDSRLEFAIQKTEEPDRNGITKVQLLFTANKGMELKPVEKAASGGELSRLMLAVQSAMSTKKSLPTLILDEIDTGVSGEVAARMGKLLSTMGQEMQLLAITHLPQVAAKARTQFEVAKSTDGKTTLTSITKLNGEERKKAIARLISGDQVSEVSLSNAALLLGEA